MRAFADLSPAERAAALLGCCALFLVLAWSSQFGIRMATAVCAALLVLVALLLPRLGILLVVFCTPIRSIFDLPQESMQIVLGSGMAAVTLRHLPLLPRFIRERRPTLLLVLAAFIVLFAARTALELLQYPAGNLAAIAREAAFYVAVLGVALAAYSHAAERGFAAALLTAAGFVLVLTMAVDTINTYFPVIGNATGLLTGAPSIRFAGLHVNPNATGKYLLFGTLISTAVLLAARSRLAMVLAVVGIVATAICFSATSSKNALLAVTGALLAYLVVTAWRRQWRRAAEMLAVTALVFATIGTWYVVLAPYAERLALRNVLEARKLPKGALERPIPQMPVMRQIEEELRIGRSYSMTVEKPSETQPANSEMYRNIPGKITYTARDCGWRCTGQRDLLWGSALAIIADHWLIGIGPHRWLPEYQARLGFPFDTPHEVWLELWGGYGLAGLALQGVLVFLLAQQVLRCLRVSSDAAGFIFLQSTALYMVAMLLAELVDPAQFLAMNPHAIWLWTFGAVQARVLSDAHDRQEPT